MGGTHSAIECIADLQEKHQARFSDMRSIRHVNIEQSKAFYAPGGQSISRPITVTGAQMSTLYIAAVQLLDRSVMDTEAIEGLERTTLNLESVDDISEMLRVLKLDVHGVLD